jgi:hypothetical protein
MLPDGFIVRTKHLWITMNNHYAILASLGAAVLLSPEITVLGLVAASDRQHPRTFAWAFGIGTIIGLSFALVIGFLLAQTHGSTTQEEQKTWIGFAVHAAIASALFVVGLYRLVNAIRNAPIEKTPEQEERSVTHRLGSWFKARFTPLARRFDGSVEIPTFVRVMRWGLLGFACDGLHPKIFPIVTAAGHEALQVPEPGQRVLGIAMFAVIALIPGLIPAVVETVHAGVSARIKETFESFMKRYGRLISSAFILAVAVLIGNNAKDDMPGQVSAQAPAAVSPAGAE